MRAASVWSPTWKPSWSPTARLQSLGHAGFDRDFCGVAVAVPVSGQHGVVGRQGGGPGEVEFAPQGVAVARVRRQGGGDGRAVFGGEAAAHHGVERRSLEVMLRQIRGNRFLLVRRDVHQKVVGRLRRQLLAPAGDEVAAHQRQQGHQEQRQGEGAKLQGAVEAVAQQLREAEAHRAVRHALDAATGKQRQPCQQGEHDDEPGERADEDADQFGVACIPGDQQQQRRSADRCADPGGKRQRRQVAPQDAQRRHADQAHQGGQAGTRQRQQAADDGDAHRRQAERRQAGGGVGQNQQRQRLLHHRADRHAEQAAQQAQRQQLDGIERAQLRGGGAEAAQQGRLVVMAQCVAMGGDGDGGHRQQQADERGELDVAVGVGKGAAQGFDALARADQALGAVECGFQRSAESGELLGFACELIEIGDAAAGLQHTGSFDFVGAQEHARGEAEHAAELPRLFGHHAGDGEVALRRSARGRPRWPTTAEADRARHIWRQEVVVPVAACLRRRGGAQCARCRAADRLHRPRAGWRVGRRLPWRACW